MEPKELENDRNIFRPLFNNTDDLIDDEKQYFTIENKENNSSSDYHKNAYENAGIFSVIFFKWVSPIINVSFSYSIS